MEEFVNNLNSSFAGYGIISYTKTYLKFIVSDCDIKTNNYVKSKGGAVLIATHNTLPSSLNSLYNYEIEHLSVSLRVNNCNVFVNLSNFTPMSPLIFLNNLLQFIIHIFIKKKQISSTMLFLDNMVP